MELNKQIKVQKNSELRKRVYKTIQSMYSLFRSSARDIQIVDKYMNVWKPRSNDVQDVVEFPYESIKGSLAEKKNATHCLFALVTSMVQLWHLCCKDDDGGCVEALEVYLNKIEFIIKNYNMLVVRGSEETGYYFKLPRGE